MRIGVISGIFHPEPGGPPTYLYYLLPELQAAGHEVRVVAFGEDNSFNYGYPVVKISRRESRRLWQFMKQGFALLRWSETLFVMGYVLPLLIFRPFYRGHIVAKVVSDFSWEYADRNGLTSLDVNAYQSARLPLKLSLVRAVYRQAVRQADEIIVPSEHVARLVRGWGISPERVHIIYNAIPDTDLATHSRQSLRRELGLPLDAYLLVSVARLTPVKGVDVAIQAMAQLPSCQFIIVGDGPQRQELEQMANDCAPGRVRFVGQQPHDMTLKYIRAADVFVLSSRTEGLSHVLLEALSVDTPVVATRVGGNPEILTDGLNGLLVPSESPSELAVAVERLRTDAAFTARLVDEGRKRSADFSWSNTVNRTTAILLQGK